MEQRHRQKKEKNGKTNDVKHMKKQMNITGESMKRLRKGLSTGLKDASKSIRDDADVHDDDGG